MEATTKLPNKHFYWIIFACALIICCECLQALIIVKDVHYYELWIGEIGEPIAFEVYVAIQMSFFLMKVIIPMMLGIYAYVSLIKVRIGRLFVFIWTVLLVGGIGYTIVEWQLQSIFYYFKIIGYLIGIMTVTSLMKVIKEEKVT